LKNESEVETDDLDSKQAGGSRELLKRWEQMVVDRGNEDEVAPR
jgi:hypothetical protein